MQLLEITINYWRGDHMWNNCIWQQPLNLLQGDLRTKQILLQILINLSHKVTAMLQ